MGRSRVRTRCSQKDPSGARCKTLVPLANLLRFPRNGGYPVYCRAHEKAILAEKAMGMTPFGAFIPTSLKPQTQVSLRHLMRKPRATRDGKGYIYALLLKDHNYPDRVRIKVGRSNNVCRRFKEHRRRCPSSKPILLGRTRLVRNCNRLERLVHIELADLSAQSIPSERNAPCKKCKDCNSTHNEIFWFRRLTGRLRGREWSVIIRPVIDRWVPLTESLV